MAKMPSSGPASTADLQHVFGQSSAGNTSQFYRGGRYVPDISQNNKVPTSGAADSADFYGATDYVAMSTPSLSGTTAVKNAGTGSVNCSTSLTCTEPNNGTGNFTYSWERVSGTSLSVSMVGRSATLSRTATGQITSSQYRCVVTDGVGTVYSNIVTVYFRHYQLLPDHLQNTYSAFATDPADATQKIEFRRDGYIYWVVNNGIAVKGLAWVLPAGSTVGDQFQIRFDNDDSAYGDNANMTGSSPSVGIVAAINGTRYAYRARSYIGLSACGVRVRIKLINGSYVFDKTTMLAAVVNSSMGGGIGIGMGGGVGMGRQIP